MLPRRATSPPQPGAKGTASQIAERGRVSMTGPSPAATPPTSSPDPVVLQQGVYGDRAMEITLQYFDDCPNWQVAEDRLRQVLTELGRSDQPIRRQRVETPEEAERVGFGGSPTILIDGIDAFPDPTGPAGYACRVYGGDAAPTAEQIRLALAR